MMTPQPKQGNEAGARADVQVCIKKLTQTLQTFGPQTEQGKAIMKAMGALVKAFGETEGKDKELVPAEIMQGLAGLAGPGKPPPGLPGARWSVCGWGVGGVDHLCGGQQPMPRASIRYRATTGAC